MKKDIPHTLTETLDKALAKEKHLFNFSTSGNPLLKITEKNDPSSPFFFAISFWHKPQVYDPLNREYLGEEEDGIVRYECEYSPSSLERNATAFVVSLLDGIPEHLTKWIDLLKEYNKESILFDDPILNRYYDELAEYFQSADEDADYAPHSFEQQKALSEYYDNAIKHVTSADIDISEANELKQEISEAKRDISRSTKSENTKRLRRIIAKSMKVSRELAKELFFEIIKEGIKWLATGQPPSLS